MNKPNPTSVYLAHGDSMSIDLYTGTKGGGAVSQFHKWLGDAWTLNDRTADMCRMRYVKAEEKGALITLTIGGNDLLADKQKYIDEGLDSFRDEHLAVLQTIRNANPDACLVVGNVYAPQSSLDDDLILALDAANTFIASKRCKPLHGPANSGCSIISETMASGVSVSPYLLRHTFI